jgi:AraC-like DNA-binding protein
MMSEEFNAAEPREIKYSYIQNIESYMDEEKPYLNPDITIEELARDLEMSVNDLSVTLNRHFQLNFFEFINQYRVREAKTLLLSKANTTITDLFYEAGFNTKSVFYSAFKKSEGVTPSQYRAMNKANLSA